MGGDAATRPRRGAAGAAATAAAAAALLLLFSSSNSSSGSSSSILFCAAATEGSMDLPYMGMPQGPTPFPPSGVSDQLSNFLSATVPFISRILSSSSEDGEGGGGDAAAAAAAAAAGPLGALIDLGKKAASALTTSPVSNDTREGIWVPLHAKLGSARDMLGLPGDDAQGVRSAARLLLAAQLPIARFAAEREACTDEEEDMRALKIVNEYPTTKP